VKLLGIDYGPLLLRFRKLPDNQTRLKIGIVLDGRRGPAWVRDLIEYLRGVPNFDVSTTLAGATSPPADSAPWLAERLYSASRAKADPFGDVDLGIGEPLQSGAVDMSVWLSSATPEAPCSRVARFGVFTLQLGEERTAPPYWREVIEAEPASSSVIHWHETAFDRARPIRTAETSTWQDWAFTRNAEEPVRAAARMLAAIGLELLSDAPGWKQRALAQAETPRAATGPRTYPSMLDTARFAGRQMARSLRVRVQGRGGRLPRWFLAMRRQPSLFYSHTGRFTPSAIEEIPLDGVYMTDPFVVTGDGKTWLYFEHIPNGARIGRLCCMEIGAGGFSKPEVILESTRHLSYPCVFPHHGEFFMIPESSGDRVVRLYRARRFPFEFQLEANLVEDSAFVDTTPFFLDGVWYFFTTTAGPFMESLLFWSEALDGKWRLHPRNPISSSVRNTRAAGRLFYQRGRLLRPTQDCSVRYGYGITINQVLRLTPSEFEERRVDFIGPKWRRGLLGTHTLNSNATVEVIDGIRYI
jgi:hypothetical protein